MGRSADDGLFWAAESATETALAAKGLRLAAHRLSRAAECSTDVATLLTDAREDIALEGRAVNRRLLDRKSARCTTEGDKTPDESRPRRLPERGRVTIRVKTPRWPDPVEVGTVDPVEWISPAETAELLDITRNTLATSWVTSRIGPRRYRVDGAFAYRRSEVESVRDHRSQLLHGRQSAA